MLQLRANIVKNQWWWREKTKRKIVNNTAGPSLSIRTPKAIASAPAGMITGTDNSK